MKKRRFAVGGFSDIDEGRDTPDQALARKASEDIQASRSEDKERGLAQGKQASFGGLGRLFQGNIDNRDSEASKEYGARAGATLRRAANTPTPVAPIVRPTPLAPPVAATPVAAASPPIPEPAGTKQKYGSSEELTDEAGTVSKFRRNTETGEAYDPGSATDKKPVAVKKSVAVKKPTVKPSIAASDKPMPPIGPMPEKKVAVAAAPSASASKPSSSVYKPKKVTKYGTTRNTFNGDDDETDKKRGGKIKAYAKGGSVSSRADGCAQRGHTRGTMR